MSKIDRFKKALRIKAPARTIKVVYPIPRSTQTGKELDLCTCLELMGAELAAYIDMEGKKAGSIPEDSEAPQKAKEIVRRQAIARYSAGLLVVAAQLDPGSLNDTDRQKLAAAEDIGLVLPAWLA